MWRRAALAALAALPIFCSTTGAHAQGNGGIDCNAFLKNPDGSWTVIEKAYIPVQDVRVNPGTVFRPGQTFLGDDMAERLSRACPNQPVATPGAEPGAAGAPTPAVPGQPRTPQIPLAYFADANGNIDVRRLTCGQLADASPEEAEFFLAWYSGWFNGRSRRPGINLARMRYLVHNVAEYCRANRDVRLTDAMERWFK